jgi:hypothetical protein
VTYIRQEWINKPGTVTPLSADRLNHLEDGIWRAHGTADANTQAIAAAQAAIDLASSTAQGLVLNVMDPRFGAKGDGVADDQPAVQAALDAARAAGGGVVLFPAGRTYRIATPRLTVRRNTTIWAYGATIVKATPTFAFLRNFDQTADSFPAYTGNSDITVLGGTWRGNAQDATGTSGNFFSFAHCENITVRDCTFIDACADAHAVEFNAVRRSRIINCRAYGFKSISGTMSEAFQLDLANSAALCAPSDNTPCADILIDGCSVAASSVLGSWPRLAGSHNSEAGVTPSAIRIVNNSAYNTLEHSIRCYQMTDLVIANNNVVSSGGIGIQVRVGDNGPTTIDRVVIANNTITGSAGDGIQVLGLSTSAVVMDAVVQGNRINACGGNAIDLQYCPGVVVTGNSTSNTGDTAISLGFADYALVTGNRCRAGTSGLAIGNSVGAAFVGNTARTMSSYGVFITANATDCSVRNNYVGGAAGGAFRASAGASYAQFVGNTARLDGVAAFAGSALQVTSGCTGVQRWGNDFLGMGATAISDSGVSPNTSTADRT